MLALTKHEKCVLIWFVSVCLAGLLFHYLFIRYPQLESHINLFERAVVDKKPKTPE